MGITTASAIPHGMGRASRVLTRAKARGIDPLMPSLARKRKHRFSLLSLARQ